MTRVLMLNGPNLGRLGSREPEIYGSHDLGGTGRGVHVGREPTWASKPTSARPTTRPSSCGWLHEAADARLPVVLNPAAFTHYSYALRDACALRTAALVEVHLSNPAAREELSARRPSSPRWPTAPSPASASTPTLLALRAVAGARGRCRDRRTDAEALRPTTLARRDRLRSMLRVIGTRQRADHQPGERALPDRVHGIQRSAARQRRRSGPARDRRPLHRAGGRGGARRFRAHCSGLRSRAA